MQAVAAELAGYVPLLFGEESLKQFVSIPHRLRPYPRKSLLFTVTMMP
jgi:hypothetical protein